jgi:hypothetical protein
MLFGRQIDHRGTRLVMTVAAIGLAVGTVLLGLATGPLLVLPVIAAVFVWISRPPELPSPAPVPVPA